MTASIEIKTTGLRNVARAAMLCGALFVFAGTAARADALADGAKNYKPYAVEHIGKAVAGAKELQAAVKAGDVKKAQAAWIKSRKGWEAIEPITGEFFDKLDEAIDAWPDAKQGYHAVEAPLFAGKLNEIGDRADGLVANLAAFEKKLSAPDFQLSAQGLHRMAPPVLPTRSARTSRRAVSRLTPAPRDRHAGERRGHRGGLQAGVRGGLEGQGRQARQAASTTRSKTSRSW